jgi:hypothetical protein
MFWVTGSDERELFAKAGDSARLLYIDAGAWCLEQVYRKKCDLPDEWFVPDSLVREWGKRHAAAKLVGVGLWRHAFHGGVKGFAYGWIKFQNTPEFLCQQRDIKREAKRRERAGVTVDSDQAHGR